MASYTVVKGDTLSKIAKANGLTLAELLELNPAYKENPNVVSIGAEITISGTDSTDSTDATATTDPVGDEKDEVGPRMSLPGNPALWKVGNDSWIVYDTTGTDGTSIRLAWKVPAGTDTQSFFGPGQPIIYNKTMVALPADVLDFGSTDDLANMTDDPVTTWRNTLKTESITQPWLLDADYQAKSLMAVLEGRPLSDSEIQQTNFWITHTGPQREWISLWHSDPASAKQRLADGEANTRRALMNSGVEGTSDEVIKYMADKLSMGDWSQTYYTEQLRGLSDPASGVKMDSGLTAITSGGDVDSTQLYENTVRELFATWLGPAYSPTDQQVAEWAGKLRNLGDGRDSLVNMLRTQRLALFPEYGDPNLTWKDISGPWVSMAYSSWGVEIDESDPFLQKLVRLNDGNEAQKLLRGTGFERGYDRIVNQMTNDVRVGMNTNVRGVV
jgi:hypothetical protein